MMIENKKILLVEPDFPIPAKSKNHHNFLPIGLLKIASYLRFNHNQIKLIRGYPIDKLQEILDFNPDEIWISSLFTYWADHVKNTVNYYRSKFPKAAIVVGGIYASLQPAEDVKKYTGCDVVFQGVYNEAENFDPAYDLLETNNDKPIDYQILHTSRGCNRKCAFCGTWIIEPEFIPLKSIKDKIRYRKLVFYDNNFLMNPYIEDILNELIELKKTNKTLWCESQSGFDGRLLLEKPYLADMIKRAGFRYPRIAWDWSYNKYPDINKQIDILVNSGYKSKEIYIFMIYNWNFSFEEMENKRIKCWEWQVQISDCRFRPLSQLYDRYKPMKFGQTSSDYYIHENYGWTDALIKQFRKNVRQQNICVRHNFPLYSNKLEHKSVNKELASEILNIKDIDTIIQLLNTKGIDYWIPNKIRRPQSTCFHEAPNLHGLTPIKANDN